MFRTGWIDCLMGLFPSQATSVCSRKFLSLWCQRQCAVHCDPSNTQKILRNRKDAQPVIFKWITVPFIKCLQCSRHCARKFAGLMFLLAPPSKRYYSNIHFSEEKTDIQKTTQLIWHHRYQIYSRARIQVQINGSLEPKLWITIIYKRMNKWFQQILTEYLAHVRACSRS